LNVLAAPRMRLGNYQPLLQLATGGMATVYVARQLGAAGFERLVVVKRVHPHLLSNHDFSDMLRDEARVASLVRHPNVVPVIDVVEADGELFLVQEYVESAALSTLWKAANEQGGPLSIAVGVRIMADVLAGLHAAHEAVDMRGVRLEVVHRDISPQNVVVGIDGGSRLIDFGVAKAQHRITETKSGSFKGKYGYMSPEQAKAVPIDRRSDLFAAGIVLHEVLTGRRLFQGENEFDTFRKIAEGEIGPPSAIVPGIPVELDRVVMRALDRDRDTRFQTAAEFLEALEASYMPAPARDVATNVERRCGARLAERRSALARMAEGSVAPLDPEQSPRVEQATLPSIPSAIRRASIETMAASTSDFEVSAARRKWWVGGVGAFVAIAAVVLLAFAMDDSSPLQTATSFGAPLLSAGLAAPSASAPSTDDSIELALTADASIESVRAMGTRSVSVQGAHARLVVAKWDGVLGIDAVLKGGRTAHVDADATSGHDLKLVVTPKVAPPAAPHAPPAAAAVPTRELQSNPYGH
jgi:serine/threonine protein kinase